MTCWPCSLLVVVLLLSPAGPVVAQVVRADGDPSAQTQLGLALIAGDRIRKDVPTGLDLLRRAAEKAHPPALRVLGDVFAAGTLVRKDDLFAVALYRAAAERGDADAQWQLADRLAQGRGVASDKDAASHWRLKAADSGHPAARRWLALLLCARRLF